MTNETDVLNASSPAGSIVARPGGLLRRLAALAYDLLLLGALLMVFTLAAVITHGGTIAPGTAAHPLYQLGLCVIIILFFLWFWTHGGQTLGARAWRLRVVSAAAGPVGWGRAALRFAAGAATLLPAGLGAWWAWRSEAGLWWCWALLAGLAYWWKLADPARLCLHDRLSGTRLVYEPKAAA